MLTLFHAPRSRSSRIITLLRELNALDKVAIEIVDITRGDGSGRKDPKNPHPEGKVPLLVHDGVVIWESIAIIQYLTDLFPETKLAPVAGDPQRGRYLSWLAWYAGVVEPVLITHAAGLSHPYLDFTFRGPAELAKHLEGALKDSPYLMGDRYTAVDLLLQSPFAWYPAATPDSDVVKAWIERCGTRPSLQWTTDFDTRTAAAA
ncbi:MULTISPECIES: glutathione S-transferase family protein [unclassified Shinella]|jgi:glutathione S-transferase|uniref:glutathione S-transferase family protein n=1 Tax=unclassified Shinella TaxID=2643062 RepID=UPI000437A298|nr:MULTISPECIES: glutathione S-transferase family protein [unclassified Shinella]MCA0343348.1 glutathione S-transferase family protein [Pseudomonadota bacterium]EYR80213.1 glutathione S-transferase [Shinella sp. DD12]MCO5148718.1 glutathione S-transferase family protein [Shinella sp.]MDC7264779.1 glutathione S-transferase family protein [Shinella sp. HY16]MDC7271676.1 glutathione S-transferase family protein [Shinella sp. YZ44]